MNDNVPPESEQNLEAPARLVAALKENAQRKIFVPPTVDDAILKAARTQLRPAAKASARWPRWALWPALAGACVKVALLIRMLTPAQFAREDLNRDGKIDILDSFALARELKNGDSLPAYLDVNGDGVVNEQDVNANTTHTKTHKKKNRP